MSFESKAEICEPVIETGLQLWIESIVVFKFKIGSEIEPAMQAGKSEHVSNVDWFEINVERRDVS
jgi:hypothetical protein